MSRHVLIDRPDCHVVLAYDHAKRIFTGEEFDPVYDPVLSLDSWPLTFKFGHRPIDSEAQANADLKALGLWAETQLLLDNELVLAPEAAAHLSAIKGVLLREFLEGKDFDSPPVPASLQGDWA